ncbi:MAG: hypothetical protein IKH22_12675 [Prevotella sp.]|nr:hypothetical protein [Prevotella sp.]
MKTKMMLTGFALAAVLSLCSCSTKMSAINQLEDLSTELRDHSRYYTARDWEWAGDRFMKIRKKISEHEFDYTPEQKRRIGQLEGECAGYMAKGVKEGIFDKIKGIGNEINGIIQGILHSVTDYNN